MVSNRDGRVTGKNLLSKRRSRGVDSGPPASQVNVHQPFFLQYFSSHHAVFLSMIYTVIFLLFFSISLKKHKNCGAVGVWFRSTIIPGHRAFLSGGRPKTGCQSTFISHGSQGMAFTRRTASNFRIFAEWDFNDCSTILWLGFDSFQPGGQMKILVYLSNL